MDHQCSSIHIITLIYCVCIYADKSFPQSKQMWNSKTSGHQFNISPLEIEKQTNNRVVHLELIN